MLLKQMFSNGEQQVPAWARRSERALPKIGAPTLRRNGRPASDHRVFRNLRRLAWFLIARPVLTVVCFAVAASQGWWPLAVLLSGVIYGATLTAVHHLIHGSLGLSPKARTFWLSVLGILVVESGHALQVTHLAHHRSNADVLDPEGYIENVTWWQLPVAALQFRYRLMWWGWRFTPRRRRVEIELAAHALAHLGALALLPVTAWPWIYLSLIHLASFGFAVLAGKGPQTNWGRAISSPFVRVHTVLGSIAFFSHDQHLEHHAYPKVPLPRLRELRHELEPVFEELDVVDVRLAV